MTRHLSRSLICCLLVLLLTVFYAPPGFCQQAPDIFTALMIHYSRQLDHGSARTQEAICKAFLGAARAGGDMLLPAPHPASENTEEEEDKSSEALEKLGTKDERVIAALVKIMGSEDASVSVAAAEALLKLGVKDERVIAALVSAAGNKSDQVSSTAIDAIGMSGIKDERVITVLVNAVASKDYYVNARAARALGRLGVKDERVIAVLVNALDRTDEEVRVEAAEALGRLGDRGRRVMTALLKAMARKYDAISPTAAEALIKLGDKDASVMTVLVSAVGSDNTYVSSAAAQTLGRLGDKSERVIAALISAVGSWDSNASSAAAEALVRLELREGRVIAALRKAAGSKDREISRPATVALIKLGLKDERAITALVNEATSEDDRVSRPAIEAIGSSGLKDERAIAAVVNVAGKTNSLAGSTAVEALWRLGDNGKHVITALVNALESKRYYLSAEAVRTLGKLGLTDEKALHAVLLALGYREPDVALAAAMSLSLGHISPAQAQALLTQELKVSSPADRTQAAMALYRLNGGQADSLNTLNSLLEQEKGQNRATIMQDLGEIALDLRWSVPEKDDTSLAKLSAGMQKTLALWQGLSQRNVAFSEAERGTFNDIQLAAERLEEERGRRWMPCLRKWYSDNKLLTLPLTYVLLATIFSVGMLLARPWWVHRLNERLDGGPKLRVPVGAASTEVTLAHLLGVGFLRYHVRVLDAWVAHFATEYEQNLREMDPVKSSLSYVPLRVKVNKREKIAIAADFNDRFSGHRACVLLSGEGGTGKTTLASQMALWALETSETQRLCRQHRMLPVIIRSIPAEDGKEGSALLIAEVRRQLMRLTGEKEALSEELTKRLLLERRLLLIADSYSEMDEPTRALLLPDNPDLPLNALIVTSRKDEPLNNVPKVEIKTGLFKPEQVSEFFGAYLDIKKKRALFSDDDFHAAMKQLSSLCKGRETTALFAVLFFDWIIESREKTQDSSPTARTENETKAPRSLPELVDRYINRLNAPTEKSGFSNEEVRAAARFLGWQFVKGNFLPGIVRVESLKEAIAGDEGAKLPATLHSDPDKMIAYFANTLHLLQSVDENDGTYKFSLDPVAEYLAVRWLFRHDLKVDIPRWLELLTSLEKTKGYPGSVSGFITALQDTSESFRADYAIPNVLQERIRLMYFAARTVQDVLMNQTVVQAPVASSAPLSATGQP